MTNLINSLSNESKELIFDYCRDSRIFRFFSCAAFEIYFKVVLEENKISEFLFWNKGSRFISMLLNVYAGSIIGKTPEEAIQETDIFMDSIKGHPYLTKMDKRRVANFVNYLTNQLRSIM